MVIRGTVPRPPHKALKTLSPGRATSNTIDLMCLRVVTGWLSTLTDKLLAPAMKLADTARRSVTEIEAGPCPHTLGVLKLIALMTGKKSAAPSGTAQERVAALPLKNPARNQTGLLCPTMQFAPVVSSRGLTKVGMESAHCHHCAVSSSRSVSEDAFDAACWASVLLVALSAITENAETISARPRCSFMFELPELRHQSLRM